MIMTSKETAVAKASSERTNATSPEEKKVDNMKIASLQEVSSLNISLKML